MAVIVLDVADRATLRELSVGDTGYEQITIVGSLCLELYKYDVYVGFPQAQLIRVSQVIGL